MANSSNLSLELSLSSDTGAPRQGNVWRPSFFSSNGPLTGEDSVMQDATTATIVAKNLLTPKDSRLLSGRSDELAVQESLALSVQCASSVSNMGQRLLARSRQVESLMAEVESLKQEIKQLKYENRSLHVLANNYSTGMKRKLDELQESNVRMQSDRQSDRQRLSAYFQRHIFPGSSSVWPSIGAWNAPAPMPSAPMSSAPMPPAPRVLPSSGASSKRPL
ncbi:S ribonuclease [Pyrus ussuriensis x Pyrus communis]|uniref:S ribonuclease n=1 Tax=Pyrus ussuriensis x Pyrus communis TaxID=2448454 RepID=A0A5N5I488_9ROSA|nr:S ribonuclease [Pyrus ussuriensis x Pyrus communis]